jgi:hypothetical protein
LKPVSFYVKLSQSSDAEEIIIMKIKQYVIVFIIVAFVILLSPAGLCQTNTTSTQSAGLSQQSGMTGGELRRYIDISSPWSGGYIHEDLTVIGRASITDSFTMNNLSPGSDVDYWKKAYDDFDIGFGPSPFPEIIPPAKAGSQAVSGADSKPAAAVAGAKVEVEAESESNIRTGFRWLDLF